MPSRNLWFENSAALSEAYARSAGTVRFEIVTRVLDAAMSAARGQVPLRVLDIGGGYGQQAIMLARLGHDVTILDPDETMLRMAQERICAEPPKIANRVTVVEGQGSDAACIVEPRSFDLVCCHSVLAYQEDPTLVLGAAVDCLADRGLLSILSTNSEARAMRSGLQGRWPQTINSLLAGKQIDEQYLECYEHSRKSICQFLKSRNVRQIGWHGVGIFTDHAIEPVRADNPLEVVAAEWLAGVRDPYRRVARTFHLIAQKKKKRKKRQ